MIIDLVRVRVRVRVGVRVRVRVRVSKPSTCWQHSQGEPYPYRGAEAGPHHSMRSSTRSLPPGFSST